MANNNDKSWMNTYNLQLTDKEFERLSKFIFSQTGIKMPYSKKIMLQSRLQKRLRSLNMADFQTYIEFVFSSAGAQEIIRMIDVVSTNKTDFFREPVHFELLHDKLLKKLLDNRPLQTPLNIWSAGCSSGEEPYTIAIVLEEYKRLYASFDYQILATDISTDMLRKGINAIYAENRIENIPLELKKRYFLKSKDRQKPTVRVISALRKKITYRRLNFMDAVYDVSRNHDIVFCRNVLIYFDRETQEKVINKLASHLNKGGYFFLGHSESITNMQVPLKQVQPTVFEKI